MVMPSESQATPGLGERFEGFLLISKSLAWIGAAAGSLTFCCTIFGFLVKHTMLEQLGVSRTMFQSTSSEYVTTGAKFLAGVVPLALFGTVEFAKDCWWTLALIAVFAVALWRWHWRAEFRVFGATTIYCVWLVAMLFRLLE